MIDDILDSEEQYDDEHEQNVPAASPFGFQDRAALAANALNDLLDANIPFGVDWTISQVRWRFQLTGLTVELNDHRHDRIVVTARSDVMPRRRLDSLRHELRCILFQAISELSWSTIGFGVMLLQIAEEATLHFRDFQKWEPLSRKGRVKPGQGWNSTCVQNWANILDNPHGVDLLTVNDTAKYILGHPITSILEEIPEELRVIHVEPVFRADLAGRFLQRRREMRQELMEMKYEQLRECISRREMQQRGVLNTVEGIADYLTQPHVTFHGAPRSSISSIVRYGFVLPGQKIGKTDERLDIRCGASFGVGIYSSPSLEYASMYAEEGSGSYSRFGFRNPADVPGIRIVVCAVLMGRPLQVTRDETRRTESIKISTAQSHVSADKYEYIVFDAAQIIPCYVLHIDFGADIAREFFDILRSDPFKSRKPRIHINKEEDYWPAVKAEKKAALKAAAAKWFPYGYGSATGTNFVIEEIGDVSDDEEEYGEFQAVRGQQEGEYWREDEKRDVGEKTSWFDEYQTVRTTYKTVKREKAE